MAFFGGANTGFGAPSAFQTPAFGGGAAQTPAPFGGFGAQPQAGAPTAFGGAQSFTTPAFGAGAATFGGAGSGAFGTPQQGSAIGGYGQGQTGFAAPAANAFGQPAGMGAFGAPTQQGGFGGATGYAAPQGGFGAAAAPSVSFGSAAPASFGATSFGAGAAVGGFGGNSGFGAGGASSFTANGGGGFHNQQATYGGQGKGLQTGFQGGKDGTGDNCTVNSICARMRDQTLESQRFIDYSQGKKGSAPAASFVSGGFAGAVGGAAAAPFGQPPTAFGQATGAVSFGQQPTAVGGFGAQQPPPQQPFGQAAPSFGATGAANPFGGGTTAFNTQKPGGAGFAAPGFGAPAVFGTGAAAPASGGLFGAPQTAPVPSMFGAAPFAPATGAPTTIFGQQPANPGFGSFLQTSAATTGFPSTVTTPQPGTAPVGASAPAPSTSESSSAPAAEPKYADASSSRIEFEDRDSGRVMNSAVYARHHNHVVARDAPPTLLWQSSRDKQQPKPAAALGTPNNKSSARDTSRSSDSTASAALSNSAPSSNDRMKALSNSRMEALKMLYHHILPYWNSVAFSGLEKAEIESDPNLNKADPEYNFFTNFKLAFKKGIHPTPIENYVAGALFKDTAGHMLVAESQAVRFDAAVNRTRTPVPVVVKMTVSGDSFTALLDMIIQKYSPGFDESAVHASPFYPFDICFEYATPFQGSDSKLVHFPKLSAHAMDDDDNPNFLENRETDCLDPTKNTVFLGFPCLGNRISGSRYVYGGPKRELYDAIQTRQTRPAMLEELLDPENFKHRFAALSEQAIPSFPRLYMSLGFDSRTGSASTLPRGTVMDLHFEASFPMCHGCKAAGKLLYTPDPEKCLGCFDMRLKQPGEFTKFLEDFHHYFKDSVTKCSLWGDINSDEQTVTGIVRDVTPLKPLVDKDHANMFTPPLTQQAQRLESCVWRFELTHSFG